MESNEFSGIRKYLGKTQSELAGLLCVSTKAIQSFEQGWRNTTHAGIRKTAPLNGGKIVLPGNSKPGISAGILMGLFVRVKCKTIGRKRCGYAANVLYSG
jgi:DNA-binding XRE family transcriptional regulator